MIVNSLRNLLKVIFEIFFEVIIKIKTGIKIVNSIIILISLLICSAFGLITNVEELTVDQLVQVLNEPKNSLVKQYQYLFELDGIELQFEKEAFESVAKRARELKTNARGLKNILEKTLLPYQFDAVNLVERGLTKLVISKESIEGKPATLIFDSIKNEKSK